MDKSGQMSAREISLGTQAAVGFRRRDTVGESQVGGTDFPRRLPNAGQVGECPA